MRMIGLPRLSLAWVLMACAAAPPPAVQLPATPAATIATPSKPVVRTRTYANERLVCALPGTPCVYFVVDRSRMEWSATGEDVPHQEVWLHGSGAPDRLLVETHEGDRCEARLVALRDLFFSPDGTHLFVGADCAAVGPSVREIDLGGGGARFLTDGTFASIKAGSGPLHIIVKRYLLDLDHAPGDPEYGGRLGYLFDVDVATATAKRVAGPVE